MFNKTKKTKKGSHIKDTNNRRKNLDWLKKTITGISTKFDFIPIQKFIKLYLVYTI